MLGVHVLTDFEMSELYCSTSLALNIAILSAVGFYQVLRMSVHVLTDSEMLALCTTALQYSSSISHPMQFKLS